LLLYGLLAGVVLGALLYRWYAPSAPNVPAAGGGEQTRAARQGKTLTVGPESEHRSIAEGLRQAAEGDTVVVAPGEYREVLELRSRVTLVSEVPLGAVIVPPEGAAEAVAARGVEGARFAGFKVNCLPTRTPACVRVENSDVLLENLDVSGAAEAGVEIVGNATLTGSNVHDNAGSGVRVREGAPQLTRNLFGDNGSAGDSHYDVEIVRPAKPAITWNVFRNDGNNVGPLFSNETNAMLRRNLVVKPETAPAGGPNRPAQPPPESQGP
jgi:hypothetical protein